MFVPIELTHMQPNPLRESPPNSLEPQRAPEYSVGAHFQRIRWDLDRRLRHE